jgi:hypothetical protein
MENNHSDSAIRCSVTLTLFSIRNGTLYLYITNNKLPKVVLTKSDTPEKKVKHILKTIISGDIEQGYLEQLYTFDTQTTGESDITIAYLFLVSMNYMANEKIKDLFSVHDITSNNCDQQIIQYALQRLRWKVEYTNVVYSLLPDEFTLSELQGVYEAILGKNLDKRNFRKKILSLGLLQAVGRKKKGVKARPAQLFTFTSKKPTMVKVFS